ncbi:hypothetical protein TPHA_0L00380 [Tetrapisispora phaffii CBS 4417]|uniref:Uncharacterized protein n=1 Tax=Tetrapisispora phaffii (strain ATCC 24235 / CBS 4417 / NBRC 1672 / NRRL Y-8282 / UCD 70-5) TaxID=1071381 RepID=G8BZR6_TETPH|nr:hypothetical protein TPHA_0L00380 [Tetrapisispora phaffii CBS 4417]CCE65394.1 hypothetical protein TPHA_0L00380 [Tetrapisispora phaffii CBS 4417]
MLGPGDPGNPADSGQVSCESHSFNLNKKRMVKRFLNNMKPYGDIDEDLYEAVTKFGRERRPGRHWHGVQRYRNDIGKCRRLRKDVCNETLIFDFDFDASTRKQDHITSTSHTGMHPVSSEISLGVSISSTSSVDLGSICAEETTNDSEDALLKNCNQLFYYDSHIQSQLQEIEKFIKNDIIKNAIVQEEHTLDMNLIEFDKMHHFIQLQKENMLQIQDEFSKTIHEDDLLTRFNENDKDSFISRTKTSLEDYTNKLALLEKRFYVCKDKIDQHKEKLKHLEMILRVQDAELQEKYNCIFFKYKKVRYVLFDLFSLLLIFILLFNLYTL